MAFRNAARFKGKISKLPAVVAAAVRLSMEQGAQEIVDAMRGLVPVESGELRDSINWCWGAPPADAKIFTSVSAGKKPTGINDNKISIFAGSHEAFYARWVEFGTRAHAAGAYRDDGGKKHDAGKHGHAATPARPFFYPIWRAYKRRLRSRITRNVNKAIKQLAASQNGK